MMNKALQASIEINPLHNHALHGTIVMKPLQISLSPDEESLYERRRKVVRSTWRAVEFGLDVKATELFYARLFDQFPSVRPMFKDNMEAQYQKLFKAVSLAVRCLDGELDKLVPVLQELGVRHGKLGVVRAHYEAVTECFLWTMNTYIMHQMPMNLAMTWVLDVADAWEWVLTLIGGIMADAAEEAEEHRKG
jgi:hemoglobin-like flavoprotein